MTCAVDWQLLLEFTKALAAPVATLVAVFIVASQARRTFLRQKTVEKRLEWYERMHVLMDRFSKAYLNLQVAAKRPELFKTRAEEIEAVALEFSAEADRAWLYAGRAGFHAVQKLQERLALAHVDALQHGFSEAQIEELAEMLHETATILSTDLREELEMEPLRIGSDIRKKMDEYRRLRSGN